MNSLSGVRRLENVNLFRCSVNRRGLDFTILTKHAVWSAQRAESGATDPEVSAQTSLC